MRNLQISQQECLLNFIFKCHLVSFCIKLKRYFFVVNFSGLLYFNFFLHDFLSFFLFPLFSLFD